MKLLRGNLKNLLIIAFFFSRILILFTPTVEDHDEFIGPILTLLSGHNPFNLETFVYPPLQYLINTVFVFLFGPTNFAFKMCTFTCDIGTVFILFKIAEHLRDYKKQEWIPAIFYAFFPTTILIVLQSVPTPNSLLFFVGSLYFFLKKKYFLTGIFAALGALIEVFPIFLVYLICIKLFAKKEYKNCALTLLGFIIVFFGTTLICFGADFINIILIHLTRQTTMLSLIAWLPQWRVDISPGFSLNIYSVIIVSVILIFGAWFYRFARNNDLSDKKMLQICLGFYLLLPLLFLNIYHRYFLWALPLLVNFAELPRDEKIWKRGVFLLNVILTFAGIALMFVYQGALFENPQIFSCNETSICTIITHLEFWNSITLSTYPQQAIVGIIYVFFYAVLFLFWKKTLGNPLRKRRLREEYNIVNLLFTVFLLCGAFTNVEFLIIFLPGSLVIFVLFLLFTISGTILLFAAFVLVLYYRTYFKKQIGNGESPVEILLRS